MKSSAVNFTVKSQSRHVLQHIAMLKIKGEIFMSKKGENIYKRKDGRWEARCIKGYDISGRARYVSCYGKTYSEAKDQLNLAKASLLQGNLQASCSSRKRFGAYCDEWLFLNKPRFKQSTYVKYESVLEKHIKPGLGGCTVSMLSTALIGEFGQELLAAGLSPKSVRDILTIVRSVLEYSQTLEPCMRPIKVIYPKDTRKEMRVLSPDEQKRLTAYLLSDIDECKFGTLLALLTGLRIGELCALRWGAISITDRTLTVSSTMLRLKDYDKKAQKKTKIILTEPKTGTSERVIPLTDFAAKLCLRFIVKNPEAFVLTGDSERFIEPRILQYKIKKYASDCGLEGVHFHVLRHTFATRCVEVGFEIKSLSEILGHTSPKFTLERYVHSSMDLKRSNMEKLPAAGF